LAPLAAGLATDPELIRGDHRHAWHDVALVLVPSHARALARAILAAQRGDGDWFLEHSPAAAVLQACARHDPEGVAAELTDALEKQERLPLFLVGFPSGVADALPHETLFRWVAADPGGRATALAHLVRPVFSPDESLAAQLAARFGRDEDVSAALFGQLVSGAFDGSAAQRWAGLATEMEQVAAATRLPALRRWAREVATQLREMAERDAAREAERELLPR
jgi:hypothetical protein